MARRFTTVRLSKRSIPLFIVAFVLIIAGLYMMFLFVPVGFDKDIKKLKSEYEYEALQEKNKEDAERKVITEILKVHLPRAHSKLITYDLLKEAAEASGWDTVTITAALITDYKTRQGTGGRNAAINRLRYTTACLIYYRTWKYKCLSQIFVGRYDASWETTFLSYRIMVKEGVRHELCNVTK